MCENIAAMIIAKRLKEVLTYHPDTGLFTRNREFGGWAPGEVAGCVKLDGYRRIAIDKIQYPASHLVWFYCHGVWPKHHMDHKNNNRDDNRIENLRECNPSENLANQRLSSRNKSGFKGVSWARIAEKWYASIKIMGKSKNLGYYNDPEEAHRAYCRAAKKYFGEFAKTE